MKEKYKNSLRQFTCAEELWEIFERISEEQKCSTDYLVNEAIRQYAVRYDDDPSQITLPPSGPATEYSSLPPPAGLKNQPPPTPPPPPHSASLSPSSKRTISIPPTLPQKRASQSSTPPRLESSPHSSPSIRLQLSVVMDQTSTTVRKDPFIIGRHSQRADLVIPDQRISRQHCCVTQDGVNFVIKDLGSRNGIGYKGKRVDAIEISEGMTIDLCGHALTFTFR